MAAVSVKRLTWQVHVTCFQDTNADSVVRVVSTLHSQQLLFLLIPLEETWMLGCFFSGKSKYEFPNPNPDFRIQKRILSVFGHIQKRIMNHKIHTQGGFFGSNPNPDFWDSQSERFFGKGFEKYFWQAVFLEKNGLNLCWWRLIKFEPYHSMFVIYSNYW